MRELLPLLPKPSRYAGREWGVTTKDPAKIRARVALAFPDLYDVGMSYLGQRILLHCVDRRPEFLAERVYAPCDDAARVLREHNAPLCTLESDTPLAEMDVLAFSLTHELCYTNVLYMLDLAGIPARASERGPEHPLVLAGGGACFNAEPLADFLDCMLLGDGEEALPRILEEVARARDEGLDRRGLLLRLKDIPGLYVPSFFAPQGPGEPLLPLVPGYERVEKALVEDLNETPFPTLSPVAFGQAVHDRLTLEIARGCTRGCRFCQAGVIYRPVRERSLDRIESLLTDALAVTGYEEVSFLSLSTGDFSALDTLFARTFDRCAAEQVAISLPSLRVGSVSPAIMERIASIRRTGATLAPEAGSQRLRDVINKGITEEQLLDHVRHLFEHGWQHVKLYFMIGLPTETPEDMEAIVDLCRKVRDAAGWQIKRLQVTAAVSPFVPKSHTPFQWERQIGPEEIRARVNLLRDLMRRHKRLMLKFHEPRMSFLEGIFSRGDRALGPVLEQAYRAGALFSSWKDHLDLEPYLEAMRDNGLKPEDYLAERDVNAPLPWDHLDCGVSRAFLLRERKRALEARTTEDCRYEGCSGCGVCNLDGRVSRLSAQSPGKDIRPRVLLAQRDQTDAPPPPPAGDKPDLHAQAARYRIWYEKTGPAAALSQLELQSVFERALRRARLPLSFSAGFHPLPRLSFGMALPVGVESHCEWLVLGLREDIPAEAVAGALGPNMPDGLALTSVEHLAPGKKKAMRAANETYRLVLRGDAAVRAERATRWREFLGKKEFLVERKTKRGLKPFDLRPLLAEVREDGDALVLRFDWTAGYISPLTLARAVMGPCELTEFGLIKIAQEFDLAAEGSAAGDSAAPTETDTER
ncbi:MAG TPA: TIGR03960 family B12-binding radical SAM protein [Desulfovibrio sp.]|uniref:TIGR03960 family B12-binding radical SAM protein n=1 Tax=Desulfovibrio TaxID=872 RepID=UPI002C0CC43B|nr:TIGR03960 family B12-binding radical SAM protein [Desulfovibrio sp.]HMM39368.1 TIGR03960 family B12-binding radical SAM protein [Desulfovibrio sp.]